MERKSATSTTTTMSELTPTSVPPSSLLNDLWAQKQRLLLRQQQQPTATHTTFSMKRLGRRKTWEEGRDVFVLLRNRLLPSLHSREQTHPSKLNLRKTMKAAASYRFAKSYYDMRVLRRYWQGRAENAGHGLTALILLLPPAGPYLISLLELPDFSTTTKTTNPPIRLFFPFGAWHRPDSLLDLAKKIPDIFTLILQSLCHLSLSRSLVK